jgi:hypothetical protein
MNALFLCPVCKSPLTEGEKNYICQNENKVIFVDSSLHEVFEIFDTSAEYSFLTLVEYYKWFKKTRKIINDIKSQIIYHKDEEKFIQESLKSHFSEKVTEKVYRLAFV